MLRNDGTIRIYEIQNQYVPIDFTNLKGNWMKTGSDYFGDPNISPTPKSFGLTGDAFKANLHDCTTIKQDAIDYCKALNESHKKRQNNVRFRVISRIISQYSIVLDEE